MSEYAVIGLGRFGSSLAEELQALGNDVVGVDTDRGVIQEMSSVLRQVFQADATSEAALREIGVADLDAAIVAVGSQLEHSILITVTLKKIGMPYVVSKAQTDLHGEILRRVGADQVVYPERETGIRLAHRVAVPGAIDYLSISAQMGVGKMVVPDQLVGMSLVDSRLEEKYRLRLLAIIREGRVLFSPSVREMFAPGDVLLLAGPDEALARLG